MYPPFIRNNVPFIPSYTFGISTTRPSRWSPRCIIFSTSIFHPFLDTTSCLGLRATSVVLRFSHCWYRRIHFFGLVMMLEIISRSHLAQFQHCAPTPCCLGLRATSTILHFSHCWYRRIHFSALVIMLEMISRSHLEPFQHCDLTLCCLDLHATSAVIRLFHTFYMSHPLLSYCKCFVIFPPFIHPARRPTSVPRHPQS